MTTRSGPREERSPPESETSGSQAEGCESTRNKPPRLDSRTSPSCALTVRFEGWLLVCRLTYLQDTIQMPGVCPDCMGQEQGKEETPGPGDRLQHVSSSSGSATHTGENEELVITSMKLISLHSFRDC